MNILGLTILFCSFIILVQAGKLLNLSENQINVQENFELVNALGDFGGSISGQ